MRIIHDPHVPDGTGYIMSRNIQRSFSGLFNEVYGPLVEQEFNRERDSIVQRIAREQAEARERDLRPHMETLRRRQQQLRNLRELQPRTHEHAEELNRVAEQYTAEIRQLEHEIQERQQISPYQMIGVDFAGVEPRSVAQEVERQQARMRDELNRRIYVSFDEVDDPIPDPAPSPGQVLRDEIRAASLRTYRAGMKCWLTNQVPMFGGKPVIDAEMARELKRIETLPVGSKPAPEAGEVGPTAMETIIRQRNGSEIVFQPFETEVSDYEF